MRFSVAMMALCSALSAPATLAQPLPSYYSQAEQAFESSPVETRTKLQIVLAAAGYLSAVPSERFTTGLFRAIQNFQSVNGLLPDGILTESSNKQLIAEAKPSLATWGMQERFHPVTFRKLWVPVGILQIADPISSGMLYKDPFDRARMQHSYFENADLASSYQHLLERARVEGRIVRFSIIRPNFYAMGWTSTAGTDAYVRYHRYGTGLYGFSLFWDNSRVEINAARAATLVSASLRADMENRPFSEPSRVLDPLEPPLGVASPGRSIPSTTGSIAETPAPADLAPSPDPQPEKTEPKLSAGTGFFVADGHVVTNFHVVDGCTSYALRNGQDEIDAEVRVVARDPTNDLALLKTSLRPLKVAAVRTGIRLGEGVATFGFPHMDMLASTGSFTRGDVTALAGIGDDTSMLQMSTPVQSGNSGGPLLDRSGNVVGVVRGKLGLRAALKTGDLPQNVNFSIKGATLVNFLDSNAVRYKRVAW
jgi:serine protease Do